jgi:hypothetical protein
MPSAVDNLKTWFDKLTSSEQKEVLQFLYGGTVLTIKGLYVGPDPNLVNRGLFCGPQPAPTSSKCPSCGRSY